jgi:hypothetical protein
MGQAPIRAAGHVLRHAVGVLLLSWMRALRAGFIAGAGGALVVEIGAMIETRHFPPDGNAQLVAALVAFALAFGAAATVVVAEILHGLRDLVGMLSGEAEAGARVAATLAEREVGESSANLLRRVGLGRLVGPQAAPSTLSHDTPAAASPFLAASYVSRAPEHVARTDETLAELAEDQLPPAATRPDATPVRADLLPRLTWSDELPPVHPSPVAPPPPEYSASEPESDAWASPATVSEPAGEALPASDAEQTPQDVAEPATAVANDSWSGLAEPSRWHAPETPPAGDFAWHDPALAAEPEDDEESYIQPIDVFGAPAPLAPTREAETPAIPPQPDPDPTLSHEQPPVGPRGSVWDHISQVLAGRPVVPLPEEPNADEQVGDDASPDR